MISVNDDKEGAGGTQAGSYFWQKGEPLARQNHNVSWPHLASDLANHFFLIEDFHDWLPNYDDEQFEWIGWMQGWPSVSDCRVREALIPSDQLTTSCTGLHLGLCFTPYHTISKYQFSQIHVTTQRNTSINFHKSI